jgi:hypothetical protein
VYSTCLFCAHDLGANESIEHSPIGRRLAFDAAKGRLWLVCRHCERWNLTPLEERWEAIEECERAYRDTRLRVATDNVGLARLSDGTELVRIGKPLRPELAAWRYGDQFGRRRRRTIVRSASAGALVAGAAVAAPLVGVPLAGVGAVLGTVAYVTSMMAITGGGRIPVATDRWLRDDDGTHLLITAQDLPSARMVALPPEAGGWGVRVSYRDRRDAPRRKPTDWLNLPGMAEATLTGPAALEAVRRILPLYNGTGASRAVVGTAVETLVQLGGDDPVSAFGAAASRLREYGARQSFGDTGSLQHLPREVRLALEMAANEDVERRAMEGELAMLEAAWRDAEEVAAIADDLLLPTGVPAMLAKLRRGARSSPPR